LLISLQIKKLNEHPPTVPIPSFSPDVVNPSFVALRLTRLFYLGAARLTEDVPET